MFILHVNDFNKKWESCNVLQFQDDKAIVSHLKYNTQMKALDFSAIFF